MSSIRVNGTMVEQSEALAASEHSSRSWPVTALKVIAWLDLIVGVIGALALLLDRDITGRGFYAVLALIQGLFFWAFLLVVARIAEDVAEIRARR